MYGVSPQPAHAPENSNSGQPDVLGAPQVPDLLDDHAVAVEEERGAERGSAGKAENFAPDALVVDAERTRRGRRLGHRATASPARTRALGLWYRGTPAHPPPLR